MKKLMLFCKTFLMLTFWYSFFIPKLYAAPVPEVIILADDSYPPYSFMESGQLKGIYIDIVKEAAKLIEPHYKVTLVAIPWKRGLQELQKGISFALLPPYKHTKERSYIWPYSVPIMEESVVAFCQKDIDLFKYLEPKRTEHNAPLIIGQNAGYLILNKKLAQAQKKRNIVISENKSTASNMMKLYYKRLDCYLNDKLSTFWQFSHLSKEKNIHFNDIKNVLLVMTKTAHIGYTNNSTHSFLFKDDFITRMDQALLSVIATNEYQKIINRYVPIKVN
jgi:polar amino acid transport system substrate-binding protein